jgi:hypothetical protein
MAKEMKDKKMLPDFIENLDFPAKKDEIIEELKNNKSQD